MLPVLPLHALRADRFILCRAISLSRSPGPGSRKCKLGRLCTLGRIAFRCNFAPGDTTDNRWSQPAHLFLVLVPHVRLDQILADRACADRLRWLRRATSPVMQLLSANGGDST